MNGFSRFLLALSVVVAMYAVMPGARQIVGNQHQRGENEDSSSVEFTIGPCTKKYVMKITDETVTKGVLH